MSLASELADEIRAAIAVSVEARKALQVAREQFTEAMGIVQQATDGTSDSRPGEAMMGYQVGIERLDEAERELIAAEEALKAYVSTVLGMGGQSTVSDAPTNTISPRPAARPSVPQRPLPLLGFQPGRFHTQAEEEARRIGWPKTPDGRTRARGLLYGADGRKLFRLPLAASQTGPASDTSDLKEPWRSGDRYKTRYHVEGHVAAHMRRNGITQADLYLNIAPCGSQRIVYEGTGEALQ